MTTPPPASHNPVAGPLQFGHAQRAWDDNLGCGLCDCPGFRLQFGHAQRAWDDSTAREAQFRQDILLQFGHAQRAWDDAHVADGVRAGLGHASIRPRPEGVG